VTIALFKDNAPKADAPKNRVINGVVELPKDQAIELNLTTPSPFRASIAASLK
jgi:hypothetical protein